VELRGIEPLSRNKQLLTSTCLDDIAMFNTVSRNVQSCTVRASKVHLQVRQPASIAIQVWYSRNPPIWRRRWEQPWRL